MVVPSLLCLIGNAVDRSRPREPSNSLVAAFVGQNAKLAWNAERFNHHYRSGSIAMAVLAVEKDGRDGRGGGDVGVGVGGGDGRGGRSTAAVALEFSGALVKRGCTT
ncbi:hypothetical protein HZH68_002023 [Vespula germanica]|uniref:Uncharacterized protein n=1 Tax=Vespula germanica TaxID=30212 RepID=A0A834KYM5_VESGE|nr:hypothetical protein HZH68_002023 [Vespula germanica]